MSELNVSKEIETLVQKDMEILRMLYGIKTEAEENQESDLAISVNKAIQSICEWIPRQLKKDSTYTEIKNAIVILDVLYEFLQCVDAISGISTNPLTEVKIIFEKLSRFPEPKRKLVVMQTLAYISGIEARMILDGRERTA